MRGCESVEDVQGFVRSCEDVRGHSSVCEDMKGLVRAAEHVRGCASVCEAV